MSSVTTPIRRADVKPGQGFTSDVKEAGDYYSGRAKAAADKLGDTMKRAKNAFTDAFKGGSR